MGIYLSHTRSQDTGRTVKGWECFIELGHSSADTRGLLYDIYFIACICDIQCSLNTCDTASDHQRTFYNAALARGKRGIQHNFSNGCTGQNYGLLGSLFHIFMNPGTLLTNVCNLQLIRVQTRFFCCFAERSFMHTRRAGTDDNAGQMLILNGIDHFLLTCFGTHILIILCMNNTRLFADDVNNFFDINRSRNICTAVADKYSYSLHFSLTFLWMGCFLLSIFTECTHQKLLRSLIIQKSRNFIRRKIILSSLTDHGKTNCLDQFGRFYVSWTALYACEAGEAFPDGLGVHQCFHIAVLYVRYKLMRTDVHFVISRTGCGTFTAFHTFSGIHTGDGTDFIGCCNFHACTSSLMPSASARSSVK